MQNAYVTELGIDPTPLMAVDLMHDVELGVAKAIIMHILRLAMAEGGGKLEEFDARQVILKAKAHQLSDDAQVPTSPNLWPRHDPKFWWQCFVIEEDDCKKF